MRKILKHLKKDWFRYGLDTIVVVIGILIAFTLNNWNQQRKLDRKAEWLMIQIQDEALNSILMIDFTISIYQSKDSIYQLIISDTLTRDDYLLPESNQLWGFTYNYFPFTEEKEGFQSFIGQADQFSPAYQSLSQNLKDVYLQFEFYLNASNKRLFDHLESEYSFAESQTWYSSVFTNDPSSLQFEFIDYLMNDYRYKNRALSYRENIYQSAYVLLSFQKSLVDLYLQINENLTEPRLLPSAIEEYYTTLTLADKKMMVGTYKSADGTSIEVSLDNELLLLNGDAVHVINGNRLLVNDFAPVYANIYTYDLSQKTICYKVLYTQQCYKKN